MTEGARSKRATNCHTEATGQYLSNKLISPRQRRSKGAQRGRAEERKRRIESAERGVGAAVPVPDFHRGGLGPCHPPVPYSGLSDPGARRCCGGAGRGIADGGELCLSAAGVLAIGAEDRDRTIVRGLVRLRHHSESDFGVS